MTHAQAIFVVVVLFMPGSVFAAQGSGPPPLPVYYVDAEDTGTAPDGTPANPYHSLSYVINTASIPKPSGTKIRVADGLYWDDPVVSNPAEEESFPIVLNQEITIEYWDQDGLLPGAIPPPAIFSGGVSGTSVCFAMRENHQDTGPRRLSAYLPATEQRDPDDKQGFEIHDFQIGVEIEFNDFSSTGSTQSIVVDGVAFYDCQQAVVVLAEHGNPDIAIRRGLIRSSDGTPYLPNMPLLELSAIGYAASDPVDLDVEVSSTDIRFLAASLTTSVITLHAESGAFADAGLQLSGVLPSRSSGHGVLRRPF